MKKPRRVSIMLQLDWAYKRHAGIFAGTQQYAQEHNWHSIVDEFVDNTLSTNTAESVPYDGIIARVTTEELSQQAARLNVPLVNVLHASPCAAVLPGVFIDLHTVGRIRAEHLLSRGLRRFANLTMMGDNAMAMDQNGFVEVITEAGCSCVTVQISPTASSSVDRWRQTEKTIATWMDSWRPPIGVVIGSESTARMVVQMCHNRGWRVPEDVAIIAGYNEPVFCEGLHPTLTSIEMGYERVGYEAAQLLDRLMDGEAPPPGPIILQSKGLVVRESTDFFAVEDKLVAAAMKFIAENCHKVIGQDDVSLAVKAETRTLQRRFQKFLKRPIVAEIRRVRIERAKRELAKGNSDLAEIARDVGFGDRIRMSEIFRRELGISPSDYRRERQLGEQTTR